LYFDKKLFEVTLPNQISVEPQQRYCILGSSNFYWSCSSFVPCPL